LNLRLTVVSEHTTSLLGKEADSSGKRRGNESQSYHGESSYEGTARLEGRHALITGADSGIGRAIGLAFAREGADVAISNLSEEKDARETERLVSEAGCQAILLPGDIGEPYECKAVAQKFIDALGNVDILVNNAAFQRTFENFEDIYGGAYVAFVLYAIIRIEGLLFGLLKIRPFAPLGVVRRHRPLLKSRGALGCGVWPFAMVIFPLCP